MAEPASLEDRIRALEDIEAIKRLKHRYLRCVDTQSWDELRDSFTEDATTAYGDGAWSHQGIEAIMRFFRESLGVSVPHGGRRGMHLVHQPEIDLTGPDTARAIWALDDFSFDFRARDRKRMGAHYHDEYVKVDGVWKIKHTGYTSVYYGRWRDDGLTEVRSAGGAATPLPH